MKTLSIALLAALLAAASGLARAADVNCIVPSKPGGAMDLTCKLAQKGMRGQAGVAPIRLSYLPGGIGAISWHTVVSQARPEPDTLVAFSGGSLLNLAQGKFGKATPADVRWVAALGGDYGMIAVPWDSPYKNLADLVTALKRNPHKVLIAVSGTIGSQDWLKMALIARIAGVDPKVLRFVALEGGGESFTAMHAGFVQVVSGDASEALVYTGQGRSRALAILSEQRLPGALAGVPTAREQGFDVVWPVIRGLYMGPKVSDADYRRWVQAFDKMTATPEFAKARDAAGLFPFTMTGPALTAYVNKAVLDYNRQARMFNLVR